MNFYKRHIGDYIKDAGHLTLLEHGVYARLMDVYYTREEGIPEDKAARLIGARTKDELQALQNVLEEFFTLNEGTWLQGRCEREIAAASAKAEKNRENGTKGGRPKKTISEEQPEENPDGSDVGNHVGSENNLIQTPDSISQTPDLRTGHLSGTTFPPFEKKEVAELPGAERSSKRNVEIAVLLREKGVKPFTFAHPQATEWAANPHVTDAILIAAVQSARDYKPTGDISPNYLRPIVEQLLNPPEAKPKAAPQDTWWTSDAGIDRKGRELGMMPKPTENYASFKDRIFEEIRKRGGKAA